MYYEPSRKNYYRFPSFNSLQDLDLRYYFPEKTKLSEEDAHFKSQINDYTVEATSKIDV